MFGWLKRKLIQRGYRQAMKALLEKLGLDMGGWKTWTGGIGMILSGAAMIVGGIGDSLDVDAITKGVALIAAGIAALGVGHKVEKAANAGGKG
jgi:hypothetical protein